MTHRRLWTVLAIVFFASFAVLGSVGLEIYRQAPPIPQRVVGPDGATVFTGQDIQRGKEVWQAMGGQQLGSIWGHGAYQAPDWSADWLHRESNAWLTHVAQQQYQTPFALLDGERREALARRMQRDLRTNTYDAATGTLTLSAERVVAIHDAALHYENLFGAAPDLATLRKAYAMPDNVISDESRRTSMSAFFFWTAWSCVTERPNSTITYTNNWPPDERVGNHPTPAAIYWSVMSLVVLLVGVGALATYHAFNRHDSEPAPAPANDPLLAVQPTPAMRATGKYFLTVALLIVVQIGMGILTAHYGVEGDGLYGIPLAKYLPYAVTRTWHTQAAIFWIATAWLATGLYIAPALTGRDPRWQRAGVNFLFVCLLVIVAGSFVGEWLSVHQKLDLGTSFWFGHQGFEYVDLGRFWQIFLFVGLFVWLALMGRALLPAMRMPGENRQLLGLFGISTLAIALFYGAGLFWQRGTHLAVAEYWRWWVVHLWVEGFFEVFATTVIAFLFVRMGLLRAKTAGTSILFSTIVFLLGGILGTLHHLYFSGTPVSVLALGASFSALEIVPLVLVGTEAYDNLRLSRSAVWVRAYRWPIYFFIAVAFWNMVGAGFFGFLINPPVALYYMQGLNTTAVHGHAALFGVYGMLGIGLMLFCLRGLMPRKAWNDRPLAVAFWCLNGGLLLMILLSLLPVGLLQAWESMQHGLWSARSAEFLQTPTMITLRWLRVPGDVLFATGIGALLYFLAGLFLRRDGVPAHDEAAVAELEVTGELVSSL